MLFEKGKYDAFYIMNVEDEEVQKELREWVIDTYRDDDTFSEERVEETVQSIVDGLYDAWLDDEMMHVEPENGLGALDAMVSMVGV